MKKRIKNNLKNNFNYNKKISRVIFSIIFFIFILNFLSAYSCYIDTVVHCEDTAGAYILMKLSDNTNAHGELASENNYNYAVCCDFPGESTNNGEDKILGLSSNTNAHAQSPELSTYSTNVYYTGLKDCRTVPKGTTPAPDEVEVVSLYSSTNSHLATVGDYDYTILCTVIPPPQEPECGDGNIDTGEECDDGNTEDGDGCSSTCVIEFCGDGIKQTSEECDGSIGTATCADIMGTGYTGNLECSSSSCTFNTSECIPPCELTFANWSSTYATVGSSVKLNVQGTGCEGKNITFEVKEKDGLLNSDDDVTTNPSFIVYSSPNTYGIWTVESQDDTDGGQSNPPEYYFIARVDGTNEEIESSNTDVDDPLLLVPIDIDSFCLGINYCSDYSEPSSCGEDLCSVGEYSVSSEITCGDGYNCGCYWNNDSTPNCNPSWDVTDSVDSNEDIDGDGIPNINDSDIDGDGILNNDDPDFDGDEIPDGSYSEIDSNGDIDGDGIPNINDSDIDGDGILNGDDPDFDGNEDLDSPSDSVDPNGDIDNDEIPNINDSDIDGDGILNNDDPDFDGDEIPDGSYSEIDSNGDIDGDGIPNINDSDIDGDGILNGDDPDFDGDEDLDSLFEGVDGDVLSIGSIGDCSYIQFGDDTCDDDSFLTSSWNATWAWATQNTFSSEDLCEESIGKTDCCFNDTIRDNKYHYDPLNSYLDCKDGEETVACPAQIQLGFFDNWNFFIVIILIFVIYYLWSSNNRKKKSFNKKKSSKRVKKKK